MDLLIRSAVFFAIATSTGAIRGFNTLAENKSAKISHWELYNVTYTAPRIDHLIQPEPLPHIAVFIHAAVDTFKYKRRGEEISVEGLDILMEILDAVQNSTLLKKVDGIYITALGPLQHRSRLRSIIKETHLSSCPIHIIAESTDINLVEFPALHAMFNYAYRVHESTALLYMHTKGVRQHGKPSTPEDWRRYMLHFLVEKNELCLSALFDFDYQTCGVLKRNNIYAGNFWWAKASWLKSRSNFLRQTAWSISSRHAAEFFLMKHVPIQQYDHYCVHHPHHDMMNCRTPPYLYRNISFSELRPNPNCFHREMVPKTPTKNNSKLWCHEDVLPMI